MRVLVTGATGFIGRHLCRELCRRGDDVLALVRPTSNTDVLPEEAETIVGDVTKAKTLVPALRDIDVVIHLAALLRAPWRDDFISANAGGIENIARACAESVAKPRLVIVSSLAAGGPVALGNVRDETMAPLPVSRYGRAKLAGERAARQFAETIEISIARPPIVVGEFDTNSLPLFRAAARGIVVSPIRGRSPVSVVHAADLACALVTIAETGERAQVDTGDDHSGVYYTPGAPPLDMIDLGKMIGDTLGVTVRGLRLPKAVTWIAAAATESLGRITDKPRFLSLDKFREATGGSWACSGKKLESLGFAPIALEARLAQTAQWYRDEGKL